MKNNIKVMLSDTYDPWFNLATENWIFHDMEPNCHTLFLWRNDNTVVIGRFQNPWTECNLKLMEEDGVKLARRQSGGGAVYQDLGNTCFTFMNGKEHYNKNANNTILRHALRRFEIEAQAHGRNDIVVDHRKISGSAFKENIDRSFHHGTLLIDTDLGRLAQYLNPDKKKLMSKGISSVRSRVANLKEFNSEINHENLCQAIIEEFFKFYNEKCEVEILDNSTLKKIPSLNAYYCQLKDWDWRFGKTPSFSHQLEERFNWGGVQMHLDVKHAVISKCVIFSDSLKPEFIEVLGKSLENVPYQKDQTLRAVELIDKEGIYQKEIEDVKNWLAKEID
ncbi:MAG: lipoate--protein ligase [Bacteriovoracia bacterium]